MENYNLKRNSEYLFRHPSGSFTGIVRAIETKLVRVKLTSCANSENPICDDGGYIPGEDRWINPERCKFIRQI